MQSVRTASLRAHDRVRDVLALAGLGALSGTATYSVADAAEHASSLSAPNLATLN